MGSECCQPEENVLVFCVIICSFSSLFVLTMTIFGVSNSAKDLDIPCLEKSRVHEILIRPAILCNERGPNRQRGSLDWGCYHYLPVIP